MFLSFLHSYFPLSTSHWYVSGYNLGFENFVHGGNMENLFTDVGADASMFRIVCKSNLTRSLAEDLCEHFVEILATLDSLQDGYLSLHSLRAEITEHAMEHARAEGVSKESAFNATLAAGKWLKKTRSSTKEKDIKKLRRRQSISHAVC